jgi:hypothetical protein
VASDTTGRTSKGITSYGDMVVPGFHSGNPSTWASHEVAKSKIKKEKDMSIEKYVSINGTALAAFKQTPETQDVSLKALASQISERMIEKPETFMLGEAMSLVVKKPDGSYSKRPHIGGEDFRVVRCYIGKREKLIYVFRALEVTDYAEMEMDEAQANRAMAGFGTYIREIGGADFELLKKNAMKKLATEAEKIKNAGKEAQYAELGFGSW